MNTTDSVEIIIVVTLPFAMAIFLQFLAGQVRIYAERALKVTSKKGVRLSPDVESIATDLAVHTYRHVSFFFSITLSSVSCIAFTIKGPAPIVAGLGAATLAAVLPYWTIKWQGMSATQLEGRDGLPMRIVSLGVPVILCVVTLLSRLG